jgi:predicted transposase YbfD/YdcC
MVAAETLHLVFRRLDCARFEAQLGAWAESVVASVSPGTGRLPVSEPAGALDGKTLWGSRKPGAPGVHLRSALAHQVDVTLAQQAVAEKTNEITAGETVRSQLVLAGRVVTRDALLTQTAVAQTIVDTGGAYGMVVKANPPQLRVDSALICANPPVGDSHKTADTLDIRHECMEPRRFTTSQALTGYRAWPELAQGFALEHSGIILSTSEVRAKTVYGMTNLASHQATPTRLLELVRGP